MLVLFAVILGGIVTGRLLQSRRLAFVSRLIAVIIWALLFLLGLEVGSDPAVVGGMATLGRTAFVIFVFSVAGSIGASWLLWRRIRGRSASGTEGTGANPASAGSVSGRELGTGGGGEINIYTPGHVSFNTASCRDSVNDKKDIGVFFFHHFRHFLKRKLDAR